MDRRQLTFSSIFITLFLFTAMESWAVCVGGAPNNRRQSGEQCDDGNRNDNDRCTNSCRHNVCGDGILYPAREECDRNPATGETVFAAFTRSRRRPIPANATCSASCHAHFCGDYRVESPEECDDANDSNTDRCTNSCQIGRCGDGFVRTGRETCDDGNTIRDNCPYGVRSCTVCGSSCSLTSGLNPTYCGDGITNGPEMCDHGTANGTPADTCGASCQWVNCDPEGSFNQQRGLLCLSFDCRSPSLHCAEEISLASLSENRGRFQLATPLPNGRVIDITYNYDFTSREISNFRFGLDGSLPMGAHVLFTGRTYFVTFQDLIPTITIPNFNASPGSPGLIVQCRPPNPECLICPDCLGDLVPNPCGNGILEEGELCDDGNRVLGDGCDRDCRIECDGGVAEACQSFCGNGIWEVGEECDRGDENSDGPGTLGVTCRTDCSLAACGDGINDIGESCDYAADPYCPFSCRRPPPPPCEPPSTTDPHVGLCPSRDLPWSLVWGGVWNNDVQKDVAVDGHGTIYVLWSYDTRTMLRQLDACGNTIWEWGDEFGLDWSTLAMALDIDECGNSFIASNSFDESLQENSVIQKVSFDGVLVDDTYFHFSDALGDERIDDVAVDKSPRDAVYAVGSMPEVSGRRDIWVRRFSEATLDPYWMVTLTSDFNTLRSNAVAVGPSGNLYVTGLSRSESEEEASFAWVVKLNPDGEELWRTEIHPVPLDEDLPEGFEPALQGHDLAVDPDENVYLSVLQYPTGISLGPHSPVVKLDSDGNIIGSASFDDPTRITDNTLFGLAADDTGVYLSGYAGGRKFDSSFTLLWEDLIRFETDWIFAIVYDGKVAVDPENQFPVFTGKLRNPLPAGFDGMQYDVLIRKVTDEGVSDGWTVPSP